MYKFLLRNGTTSAFVIGFLVSMFVIYLAITGAGDNASDDYNVLYNVKEFGIVVGTGRLMVYLGVIAIVLGGLYGFITNPKASLKFLIGIVVLLAIVGILYAISKDETSGPIRDLVEQYDIQGTISRLISGGILATVILLGIAFVTVLLAEVRNAFK